MKRMNSSIEGLKWYCVPVLLVLLALLTPSKGNAQALYGSIVGRVTDSSGAAVPGASVTIINKGTGQSRRADTNQDGDYNFTDVQTGSYQAKVSKEGFKTFERTDVPVTLNNVTRVDLSLQIGSVNQTVTVTSEAPVLQTDTSEVKAELSNREFENLPVPLGRNYQQIYRALPGFSPPQNSHSLPTNPARSLEFSVNGTSDNQNNTRIDGVSTYNIQLPHVTSYVPTLESIQDVNIVTDSFHAEQGMAGDAAINVQTKSGGNQIHGSLFEYHSNNHLKAWPEEFDAAPTANIGNKPKLVYNQFGGTVGGPIKKDKLFYFASYEGTYDHRGVQRRVTVPTPAMKQGDFSASDTAIYDPLTGDPTTGVGRTQFSVSPGDPNYALCNTATNPQCLNIIPAGRLDPIAQKIIALIPDPNLSQSSLKNNYFASGPFSFNRQQLDSKVNWNASPKLSIIGTFGVLHYDDRTPTVFSESLIGRPIGGSSNPGHGHGNTYRFTIMGTYTVSPSFLIDAHIGWARQGTSSEQPDLGKNIGRDVLGIPGTNGTRRFESSWPEFDLNGTNGDFATLGVDSNFMPYYRQDPQRQVVVNANWTRGSHNARFGTEIYRQALNHTQAEFLSAVFGAQGGFNFGRGVTSSCLTANPDGTCATVSDDSRYNSFASFVLGLPVQRGRTLQAPDVYHVHTWVYSAYARDRWNLSSKLTLDYGLRWEYFPVPQRPDRGIERFDLEPTSANFGKVLVCGIAGIPKDCGIEVSKKRFAPRIGLAYRATNSFVIRAGYGITNDPYEAMEPLRANYPILLSLNQTNIKGSLFPVGILAEGIPTISPPNTATGIIDIPPDFGFIGLPKKFDRGYVQSWNFTIQKELGHGFTGQVGYVATRQTRELAFLDVNAGQVIGGGDQGRTLLPKLGRVGETTEIRPIGTGHYDSLQASLQRRFNRGLDMSVNYTWGKAVSSVCNSDNRPGADNCNGGGQVQALRYFNLNRGIPSLDRPHNLEMTSVWQLPFGTGRHWLGNGGAASAIAGGWQINTLLSLISGQPFTAYADATSLNLPGSTQQADLLKHPRKLGGIGVGNPYYDPTAFADISDARFGTSGFNILRGPGIVNWDFGVFREFGISERIKLQFRAEAFNFTNTPHFNTPEDGYTCVCDGSDFMTITTVTNLAREGIDERQFRFGLRLSF